MHKAVAQAVKDDVVEGATRPVVPSVWSSKVNQTTWMNGTVQTSIVPLGDLFMVEDDGAKRKATTSNVKFGWAPEAYVGTPLEFMNFTTYYTETYMGFEINGQHLDASIYGAVRFSPTFSWLPAARDGGMVEYSGTSYQSWVFTYGSTSMLALFDAAGVPVYLDQNVTAPSVGRYRTVMAFSEWRADASHLPHVWDGYNQTTFTHPTPCPAPADPTPVEQPIYIFHPKDNFDIAGQDVGDGTGDVFFVCVDVLTNRATGVDHHYQWLSSWTVTHNPQIGQYQNCNGYPPRCLGAEDFLVGHEAAQGLGSPSGGMCTTNPQTGEWWSLPVGGQCAAGASPSGGTCSWSAVRTKTIDAKCLLDQLGFKEACEAGQRAPFAAATRIFLGAFATDDPATGGCPPLNVTGA